MVPDSVCLGFTAEIPLPNQGFPAKFLVVSQSRFVGNWRCGSEVVILREKRGVCWAAMVQET